MRQETRGLNELTGKTYALRSKEEAEDYRYMPDSNLPAIAVKEVSYGNACLADSQDFLDSLRKSLPEMPWVTVKRLTAAYGLDSRDVETLIGLDEYHGAGIAYFEEVVGGDVALGRKASNW